MSKFNISSMVDVPDSVKNGIRQIAIDSLVPYKNHCFTLYSGERLDDMVKSVEKNGIMIPIIVRTIPDSDKFEILSGHNRVYAAGMAGKKNVPAVVKENLSDEEAEVYVIETNLIQRGFKDLKISEQAFAVAVRYKKLFDQKKIQAISDELRMLEHGKTNSRPPVGDGGGKRIEAVAAEEYGIGHSTVARLLRINELNSDFKKMVDDGKIKVRSAVELSFLSKGFQTLVYTIIEANGIETVEMKTAKELREISESYSNPSAEVVEEILLRSKSKDKPKEKEFKIIIPQAAYTKYLKKVPKKDIGGIIEKALEMYFGNEGHN